jgi:hypothetical protein
MKFRYRTPEPEISIGRGKEKEMERARLTERQRFTIQDDFPQKTLEMSTYCISCDLEGLGWRVLWASRGSLVSNQA